MGWHRLERFEHLDQLAERGAPAVERVDALAEQIENAHEAFIAARSVDQFVAQRAELAAQQAQTFREQLELFFES